MAKPTKPEPVVIQTICSMCQLDWAAHGEDPTTEDCIRLLKVELAMAKRRVVINQPPVVYPPPGRLYPVWGLGTSVQPCASPPTITCQNTVEHRTPRLAEIT